MGKETSQLNTSLEHEQPHPVPRRWWPRVAIGLAVLFTLALTGPKCHRALNSADSSPFTAPHGTSAASALSRSACPAQPDPLHPRTTIQWTDEKRDGSAALLSAAVQIPTQSYDDNGEPGEDERWAPFFEFQKWLEEAFPTAWKAANVEFVNTLGIVATFEGSDPSLKPLLLMSHYDVTPAPDSTLDRWTHPPFSGFNDGEKIWGRGASDDKTLLVAQWEAITYLLEAEDGFKPRRTLILSHGFDEEEVFARRGQGRIAPFLEERYGKEGLLMVIDEGTGTDDGMLGFGAPFAIPAMGEKGYLDIVIKVGTDGGHSSMPPVHTGIGIMSQIVTALEDHPFERKLSTDSPILTWLQCGAEHGPAFPKKWAKLLSAGPKGWDKLSREFAAKSGAMGAALVGTTMAVDVVNGGVKVNALPELVTAMVNFRIDFSESIADTKKHVTKVVRKVAKKNELDFTAWKGKNSTDLGGRFVNVEVLGLALEPAPRTPSEGGVWELFAGTVRAALPGAKGEARIVAPFASTGNTDCKMYYNLSKNVYRFMGGPLSGGSGIHTVNEWTTIAGHWQVVDWVHAIIQNADAYEGEE